MKNCKIEGCDEEVGDKSRSGICHQCTSSLYYWTRRSAARVLRRRGQLKKYTSRLQEFFDDKGQKAKPKASQTRANKRGEGRPANARLN